VFKVYDKTYFVASFASQFITKVTRKILKQSTCENLEYEDGDGSAVGANSWRRGRRWAHEKRTRRKD
jgi:hypothetical protein